MLYICVRIIFTTWHGVLLLSFEDNRSYCALVCDMQESLLKTINAYFLYLLLYFLLIWFSISLNCFRSPDWISYRLWWLCHSCGKLFDNPFTIIFRRSSIIWYSVCNCWSTAGEVLRIITLAFLPRFLLLMAILFLILLSGWM